MTWTIRVMQERLPLAVSMAIPACILSPAGVDRILNIRVKGDIEGVMPPLIGPHASVRSFCCPYRVCDAKLHCAVKNVRSEHPFPDPAA
jgi:hypothetical protein